MVTRLGYRKWSLAARPAAGNAASAMREHPYHANTFKTHIFTVDFHISGLIKFPHD
jgi:hypothetical protein